MSFNLAYTTKL